MIFTYWSKCANDGNGENQLCCVKEIIIANTASKLLRTVISMSPCFQTEMNLKYPKTSFIPPNPIQTNKHRCANVILIRR